MASLLHEKENDECSTLIGTLGNQRKHGPNVKITQAKFWFVTLLFRIALKVIKKAFWVYDHLVYF